MQIIDSLKTIFDKKGICCDVVTGDWILTEPDPSATFVKMTFHNNNAYFGSIDNSFYKGVGNVTTDRSTYLKDKDCDGLCFYVDGYSKKLLLVDMKSSFSEDNVFDAFRQDVFTFLKVHMMFSLCEGYHLPEWEINCYIACPPCKNEAEITSIKDNINMAEELGDERFINKCLKEYFYGNSDYACSITRTPFCKNKPLHDEIVKASMHFHIVCPSSSGDTEGFLNM